MNFSPEIDVKPDIIMQMRPEAAVRASIVCCTADLESRHSTLRCFDLHLKGRNADKVTLGFTPFDVCIARTATLVQSIATFVGRFDVVQGAAFAETIREP